MNSIRRTLASPKFVKIVAAIVVGLSVGTLLPPEPVMLPMVGATSGVVVGGVGLVAGSVLYLFGPDAMGSAGCDCSGDCGCS